MPIIKDPKNPLAQQHLIVDRFTGGLRSQSQYSKVQYDDTECTSANNIEFYPVGVISKKEGITKLHTTPWVNSAITHLDEYTDQAGNYYLLAFSCASGTTSANIASVVFSAGTAAFTSLLPTGGASSWNPQLTNTIITESFGGSAIAVNGVNVPYVWSSTGGPYFLPVTSAPTGAAFIKTYRSTAFLLNIAGASSRVQWSALGDFSTWPVDQFMDLDADDGDYLIGAEIINGELIVTKNYKIYAIDYTGGQAMYYAEMRVDGFGCGAPKTMQSVHGLLHMYGIDTMYSFDGVTLLDTGNKIKDLVLNINPGYRQYSSSIINKNKSQLWFLVPYGTSSTLSTLLVYDYDRQNWTAMDAPIASLGNGLLVNDKTYADLTYPYTYYSSQIGSPSVQSNSDLILGGTYDGYITQLDAPGVDSDFGGDINGYWRSKWFDMGNPEINKRILRMTVWVEKQSGDYNLTLNIRTDWQDDIYTSGDAIVYTAVISLSGSTPVLERRLDFTMQARAFQFEFMTSKKNQPFKIHKFIVDFYDKGRTII